MEHGRSLGETTLHQPPVHVEPATQVIARDRREAEEFQAEAERMFMRAEEELLAARTAIAIEEADIAAKRAELASDQAQFAEERLAFARERQAAAVVSRENAAEAKTRARTTSAIEAKLADDSLGMSATLSLLGQLANLALKHAPIDTLVAVSGLKPPRQWPQCVAPDCEKAAFAPSSDQRLCYEHFVEAGGAHYRRRK